jgi:hypothetical protein
MKKEKGEKKGHYLRNWLKTGVYLSMKFFSFLSLLK